MAVEVERNFLVTGDERRKAEGTVQRQGHLSTQPERTVRVRIEDDHLLEVDSRFCARCLMGADGSSAADK